jgi:uncharacterized membrane protein
MSGEQHESPTIIPVVEIVAAADIAETAAIAILFVVIIDITSHIQLQNTNDSRVDANLLLLLLLLLCERGVGRQEGGRRGERVRRRQRHHAAGY